MIPLHKSTAEVEQKEQLDIYKYKYALDNSRIGMWEWNMQESKVYLSNESKKIFGYDVDEMDLLKIDWKQRIHPDDLEQIQHSIKNYILNKTKEYRSEHRIISKDGTYKWVLDSGKIIAYDKHRVPSKFIGTSIDITQRKEDEERLRQDLSVITNQNKKLTNFAHIVTHNLKEHAGNFESLLGFYLESTDEESKDEMIQHLITVSDSLTKTISSLKDIVASQSHTKIDIAPLNFNKYVNKVIEFLQFEIAEKDVIINNKVSDDLVLFSNETYLESIILNLASNALKYSHPERQPIVTIDVKKTKTGIKITLEDNGVGIDLEKHGHEMFNLYKTFHGNNNAEGIGLYITKNQIEDLGGIIEVQSVVGEGTTFIMTIDKKKNNLAYHKNA